MTHNSAKLHVIGLETPPFPCTEGSSMSPASSLRRPAFIAGLAAAVVAAVILYPSAKDNSVSTESVAYRAAGISFGAAGKDMRVTKTLNASGVTIKRSQQYINGMPVFGGEIVEFVGADGTTTAALGKVAKESQGQHPADDQNTQNRVRRSGVATFPGQDNKATSAKQVWFDPALFGMKGAAAVPAYQVETTAGTSVVEAASGTVLWKSPKEKEALNRAVCDLNNKSVEGRLQDYACGVAVKPGKTENGGNSQQKDVNNVFKFFDQSSTFYNGELKFDLTQNIGADYGDGVGKALRGTVRVCFNGQACPLTNAFWDGTQMTFGEGVTTLDVTGHELTHGVSQAVNGLGGQGEPGALNEGMSDIFGAFINQANGAAGADKWLIGKGTALGVIRDMANPGAHQQPDKFSQKVNTQQDNGGVHINNGIVNKTAFLVTDGQNFNGQNIKGIGSKKAIQLFWLVENSLTSSSGLQDWGKTVNAACKQLSGSGTLSAADCAEVAKATKATEVG
ncbi:M4 family peptidase [Pseudonocardiaceae bacterium YIM PH 21723]|nr:M4 family peptidase [Pseudonocardiaceae bacterium YIM PH 21723]